MRSDVYQKVTDKIIADLEKGELTWLKPWNAGHAAGRITRPLRHNGRPYGGINVLMLWAAAVEAGYLSACWMTFRQAHELGAHVRKGEKGSMVVYAGTISRSEDDDEEEEAGEEVKQIPFLKSYTVFNTEQIEGLPEQYQLRPEPVMDPLQQIAHADQFFAATGADIRYGGSRAYYSAGSDHVQMPHFESFRSAEAHAATLAHEIVHWTKRGDRLNRDFGHRKWGDEGYAREELVAELGAAFLCADLALTPEPAADHAAYIHSWLKVLKEDKRAIFSAAAHAQRAVEHLHGLQSSPDAGEGTVA
ncbi:MAG: zincin-like metallopeptidase domain-containing protein [Rhizobiaceae bacterium]|nr:zincin-like metallopeptidase domain-containing protein [Rhizobiaceae bacterium]MCZ8352670.1 zincin-like metallopeptidase domain-containing protein [Rhizobium sp.]